MGKDTLIIGDTDHSFSSEQQKYRHEPSIPDASYTYEEVKEMILKRPWLTQFLDDYFNFCYKELTYREFYSKIKLKDKYLIRYPIIIDFLDGNNVLEEWRYEDNDYDYDDASDISDAETIKKRLQLYALRILKPIEINDPSTSENIEISLENLESQTSNIKTDFIIQYGLCNFLHEVLKKYFEQRDIIKNYLTNDLRDIFPKKNIAELSEKDLMNGIFYIQMKQLESFKDSYGEDGRWYDSIRIYYDD